MQSILGAEIFNNTGNNEVLTLSCMSLLVTIQYWHLRKADASALYPPTDHAARLSAEKTVTVPRKKTCFPSKSNSTPK